MSKFKLTVWTSRTSSIVSEARRAAAESGQYEYEPKLRAVKTVSGEITELASAVKFSNMPRIDLDVAQPFGADPPQWSALTVILFLVL